MRRGCAPAAGATIAARTARTSRRRHRPTEKRYATLISRPLVSNASLFAVSWEGEDAGCASVSIKKRSIELRDFGLSGKMLEQVSVRVVCEQGEALRQRASWRLREAHATLCEEE